MESTRSQRPSGLLLNGVSAEENEYLAKEELVTIVSRITEPQPYLFISGKFGPLEAGVECDVPLWLALHLRKSNSCNIKIPLWLQADRLKEVLEEEKQTQDIFQPMPFHYVEISQLLLTNAWDDFANPDEVRTLVRDVENIRMDRLRIGALDIAGAVSSEKEMPPAIRLANIGALEILAIRGFLMESLKAFKELTKNVRAAGDDGGGADYNPTPGMQRPSTNRFTRRRDQEE